MDFTRLTALINPEMLDEETAGDVGRLLALEAFEGSIDYVRGLMHIHGVIAEGRGPANLADHVGEAGVVLEWCSDSDQESFAYYADGRAYWSDPAELLVTPLTDDPVAAVRAKTAQWEVKDAAQGSERFARFQALKDIIVREWEES